MSQLSTIVTPYEALIVDLWGVVHDGTALYPGAAEALDWLHAQGKPVLFLSNAPRVAAKAQETLDRLGVNRAWYAHLVTSGQVAHDALVDDPEWLGTRYYYLGPSKDEDILNGARGYQRVAMEEAEFVLNTGYEVDFQPHDEVIPTLEKLLARNLPLLCVNPDHEVVKQDGTRMLCAGTLADQYADMRGEVHYIGKPFDEVYERAFNLLGTDKLLAIGDNPLTDILGANHAGIDSLLITGGVLAIHHGAIDETKARALCAEDGAKPTFVLPGFAMPA